jgi:uncharacterized membrane protein
MGEPGAGMSETPARKTGDNGFDDEKMEYAMGMLLRLGVLLAATVVIAGGAMYLADHHGTQVSYRHFVGHPISVRHPAEMTGPTSLAVLDVGILLLVAVPIARVAFAVVAFLVERDWLYTAVSALILTVLVWGMLRSA